MRDVTGLVLHLGKTLVVNFTRRGHIVVNHAACDGLPCVMSDVGKYMGGGVGPGSFFVRWRDAVHKYLSRARNVKTMALLASHVPLAYNYLVASMLSYPAVSFDPDSATRRAERVALAVVHSAPKYVFSPDMVVHVNSLGSRVACISIERMAWASKLRLVLSVPEVRMALARVERARAVGPCLVARHSAWRQGNIVAAMERADRAEWGLPAEMREGAGIQRRISASIQSESGLDRLCTVLARRAGRLYGAATPAGRVALVTDRLRCLFLRAGTSVAMGALRIIVNGSTTTRRFGQGPQVYPFGCFAAGGDDVRHASARCSSLCLLVVAIGCNLGGLWEAI